MMFYTALSSNSSESYKEKNLPLFGVLSYSGSKETFEGAIMWLKTKVGKRVNVKSVQKDIEWEGNLVDVDAIGLTINADDSGLTFIQFLNVCAVRVLEL